MPLYLIIQDMNFEASKLAIVDNAYVLFYLEYDASFKIFMSLLYEFIWNMNLNLLIIISCLMGICAFICICVLWYMTFK